MARNAGFVVSALVGAAAGAAAATLFFGTASLFIGRPLGASQLTFVFACAFLIDMLCVFTAGFAWHTFAQRRCWTGAAFYIAPAALGGLALCGALTLFMVIWALDEGAPRSPYLDVIALPILGLCAGAATGLAAWLIRRPDRNAANPATQTP